MRLPSSAISDLVGPACGVWAQGVDVGLGNLQRSFPT